MGKKSKKYTEALSKIEKGKLYSLEEAVEIMQTRLINSINARPGIFRNLGKNTYGESRVLGGYAQPVYNNRK